jgi:hypothetical protein
MVAAQNREAQSAEAKRLHNQAFRLYKAGRYDEAILLEKEAIAVFERAVGEEHPDVATALQSLAEMYRVGREDNWADVSNSSPQGHIANSKQVDNDRTATIHLTVRLNFHLVDGIRWVEDCFSCELSFTGC